jgi:hypothetical protein
MPLPHAAIVHGKEKGKVASFYKQFARLHLTDGTIDALLNREPGERGERLERQAPRLRLVPGEGSGGARRHGVQPGAERLMTEVPLSGTSRSTTRRPLRERASGRGSSDTCNAEIKTLLTDAAVKRSLRQLLSMLMNYITPSGYGFDLTGRWKLHPPDVLSGDRSLGSMAGPLA